MTPVFVILQETGSRTNHCFRCIVVITREYSVESSEKAANDNIWVSPWAARLLYMYAYALQQRNIIVTMFYLLTLWNARSNLLQSR